MEDKAPFQNAFNEGSFLTFYRDHSNPDWWCCSNIHTADIPNFHNESPTFLFSIGCSTNNFWNNWSYDGCVAESFLRADNGAIGSLGANTVTYSQYNDLVTWGMFDYFWPDYMPTLGSQTEADFYYPSFSLVAGKLFLSQQAFLPYSMNSEKIDKTLNLFSFLGETYLNLYTETPQQLQIEAPLTHLKGPWQYQFTAEEGATVCLSKDGEIIQVLQATGETQSVALPTMEAGEQFTVTATKQNHFRFEQNVTIINGVSRSSERHTPDFELFPNPTDEKVSLVLSEELTGVPFIEVYNLLGEKVLTQNVSHLSQNETLSLDLSALAPGLYFIKLSTENGSCSRKVSVK